MKKSLILAAVAVAALSACVKEVPVSESIQADNFSVTIESDALTRTYLAQNSEGKYTKLGWSGPEHININGSLYHNETNWTQKAAIFRLNDGQTAAVADAEGKYKAYYPETLPYSLYNGGTPTLPSSYSFVQVYNYREADLPMYAESTTTTLQFKNICGVLAVTLSDADVHYLKSITVSSSNRALSGAFTVDANSNAVLTDASNIANTASLVFEETALSYGNDNTFYIPVPPATYKNLKLELIYKDDTRKEMCTCQDRDIVVARNTIYPISYEAIPYITISGSGTIQMSMAVEGLECSVDGGPWQTMGTDKYTFSNIRLRSTNHNGTATVVENYSTTGKSDHAHLVYTGSSSNVLYCSGDLRTLVDYRNYKTVDTKDARFCYLFAGLPIKEAPDLPATVVPSYAYYHMFDYCTKLNNYPLLPATEIGEYCYSNMFYYCIQLTGTYKSLNPVLPATTLKEGCYKDMFACCYLLQKGFTLPATDLVKSCYEEMYMSCQKLETEFSFTINSTADKACYCMFYNCYNLNKVTLCIDYKKLSYTWNTQMFYNAGKTVKEEGGTPTVYCSFDPDGIETYVFYGAASSNRFFTAMPITPIPTIDLSEKESANCYVVTGPGKYKFAAVKGNSSESVGTVSSVSRLWATYGTSNTFYNVDADALYDRGFYRDGYITFYIPENCPKGNVTIAAKNSSNAILWSWHIWLTDTPADVDYGTAGKLMDRNLGATTTSPDDVRSLGLLYQWGRKDPFLNVGSIGSSTRASSHPSSFTNKLSVSSVGTVEYSIKNPTVFIMNNDATSSNSKGDWHFVGDDNLWSSTKTIYDPCPVGYHVPSADFWSSATLSIGAWDSTKYGRTINGSWYPASGVFHRTQGTYAHVAASGYYWSADREPDNAASRTAYAFVFNNKNSGTALRQGNCRAWGFAVRCQKQ